MPQNFLKVVKCKVTIFCHQILCITDIPIFILEFYLILGPNPFPKFHHRMRLRDGGELYIIHTIGNFLNSVLMVNFLGCTFLGGHVFYEETTLPPPPSLALNYFDASGKILHSRNSLGVILSTTTAITSFFCSNYQTILTVCPSPQ